MARRHCLVETVDAARVLVEELGLDANLQNEEGQTAGVKIEAEADWPEVAEYLQSLDGASSAVANGTAPVGWWDAPASAEGLQVTMGTMNEAEAEAQQPVPELRRRIEELAAREDLQTPEGQAELRRSRKLSAEGFSDENKKSVKGKRLSSAKLIHGF